MIPKIFPLNSAEQASITPKVRGMREKYVAAGYRMLKNIRYANTVNSGESPLIVWTSETGILAVAVEDSRCPPIWKAARGSVVMITSREGARMPCRRDGTLAFKAGNTVASHEKKMQKEETKANWIRVRVAGLGSALRIDFDDVFVKALDRYQIIHRICANYLDTVNIIGNGVYERLTLATLAPSMHLQSPEHSG